MLCFIHMNIYMLADMYTCFLNIQLICASINACLSYFASLHTSATVDL